MPPKFAGKNDEDIHVYSPIILSNCSSPISQMPFNFGGIKEDASLPRPWAELPPDITMNILHRLGAVKILETAQKVCTTWYGVCKDPSMWRVIDMRNDGNLAFNLSGRCYYLEKMCCHAVDRSQGQLVDINLEFFATNALLDYIAGRSGNLKRLRLHSCSDISTGGLAEAIKGFPKLESLNVSFVDLSSEIIEIVGRFCPLLCLFSWEYYESSVSHRWPNDEEALAIARSMPELRILKLIRNSLTNVGLEAIINGCPYLESLDLGRCNNVNLKGDLEKKLNIKFLKYAKMPYRMSNCSYLGISDSDYSDSHPYWSSDIFRSIRLRSNHRFLYIYFF